MSQPSFAERSFCAPLCRFFPQCNLHGVWQNGQTASYFIGTVRLHGVWQNEQTASYFIGTVCMVHSAGIFPSFLKILNFYVACFEALNNEEL